MTIIGTKQEAISLEDGTIHLDNVFLEDIAGAVLVMRLGNLDFSLNNLEIGDNVQRNETWVSGGGQRHHITLGHTPIVIVKTTVVSPILGGVYYCPSRYDCQDAPILIWQIQGMAGW